MKKTKAILFLLTVFSFTSCITTLHPLVTVENAMLHPQIEGGWKYKDQEFAISRIPDSLIKKIIGKEDYPNRKNDSLLASRSYFVVCQKDGIEYHFNLGITRLGDDSYIELAPAGFIPKIDDEVWQKKYGTMLQYLPTYTIAKFDISKPDRIVLKFLNGSFIKEQALAGKIRIKHETNNLYDMFLISASSRELVQFLKKYGNDEKLYNTESTIILKRKLYGDVSKNRLGK